MANTRKMVAVMLTVCVVSAMTGTAVAADPALTPKVVLTSPEVEDQDDMCIWLHPEDPARSTIITSDKAAGKLFVYDLEGKKLQTVAIDGKPGNIDLRYGFPLDGKKVDIVGLNERDRSSILLYRIDPATRKLVRADDGAIKTGPNYGFCLYHSAKTGTFHAFTVAEEEGDGAEQYELSDNGSGKISGTKVRAWELGHSEGCVADDGTGQLYIGEEDVGIWKVDAEPDAPTPGKLIIKLGPHDFEEDVEGLTICRGPNGSGYLIASSQGNGQFKIFKREAPHDFVQSFTVEGADETDGIDILNVNLGPAFPSGVFTLHNGGVEPCPILICDPRGLGLDLFVGSRDPRKR